MRLKSFYAKTMTEAMQMVRNTLGEEAIIVSTREENGGKTMHVTAAIEPAFEVGNGGMSASSADEWLQYDDEQDEGAIVEELTDILLNHSVPEAVTDHIISCATVAGLENPAVALSATLEHLFSFRPLPRKAFAKPIIMVGVPGAGKTLAVAKLAARSVMSGLRVGVISCDTVRAGGIEQLESFTRLLRIDLKKAADANELQNALNALRGCDQIIIDTPGVNPFDDESLEHMSYFMKASQGEAHMVLPAGLDAEESGDIARAFKSIGVSHFLPTRLDAARRLGGILSAAHYGGMAFSDAGNTPKVADGLVTITPESLTNLLMPRKNTRASSSIMRRNRRTGS